MCRPNHALWYLLSRKSNCSSASVQSRFPFLTFHALKSVHVQVRIFDNQALHPHTLTPSHAHNLTPHTLTFSQPHNLTPSHTHMLTTSHPHTSYPHTLTPSYHSSLHSHLSWKSRQANWTRTSLREKRGKGKGGEKRRGEEGGSTVGGTMIGALFDWTTLHASCLV